MRKTMLTPEDVCGRLSISRDTLHRLVKSRSIAVTRITPKCLRFEEEEIERYVTRMTRRALSQ
jgi:excisionase family DNA binding protein